MAALNGARELQKPIRKRRLAMIDMSDDGEIPDPLRRVLAQINDVLFGILTRLRAETSQS